jgi:hypothetical protein
MIRGERVHYEVLLFTFGAIAFLVFWCEFTRVLV